MPYDLRRCLRWLILLIPGVILLGATVVLGSGYLVVWMVGLNGLLTLVVLTGFGISISRLNKRLTRSHGGLCTQCGYDRSATGEIATCPECGSTLLIAEDRAKWSKWSDLRGP